ncbi:MAG: hypothetical protein JO022_03180 [Acidobacteriaceae bacterium]|nr:hypothetical protein [Acidobacteriaceae bacterium]
MPDNDENLIERRFVRKPARDFMNARTELCVIDAIALHGVEFDQLKHESQRSPQSILGFTLPIAKIF